MICLSPSEIVLLGTEIAISLAKNKSADEITVLRNLATQIAATLLTYSSQDKVVTDYCNKKD
ncbi:hypothetical protein EOM82_08155 [bacterium]|nr:hypothetical protein [bacterium]